MADKTSTSLWGRSSVDSDEYRRKDREIPSVFVGIPLALLFGPIHRHCLASLWHVWDPTNLFVDRCRHFFSSGEHPSYLERKIYKTSYRSKKGAFKPLS